MSVLFSQLDLTSSLNWINQDLRPKILLTEYVLSHIMSKFIAVNFDSYHSTLKVKGSFNILKRQRIPREIMNGTAASARRHNTK